MAEHKDYVAIRQLVDILDTNGDGTGDTNANGNYLVEKEFFCAPPEDEDYLIYQMSVGIEDSGKISYELYGNNVVLIETEGCTFEITNNDIALAMFDERVSDLNIIQTNRDYIITTVGNFIVYPNELGNKFFGQAVYKFNSPKILRGSSGDRLSVKLLGDFSNLTNHGFYLHGQVVKHRLKDC